MGNEPTGSNWSQSQGGMNDSHLLWSSMPAASFHRSAPLILPPVCAQNRKQEYGYSLLPLHSSLQKQQISERAPKIALYLATDMETKEHRQ